MDFELHPDVLCALSYQGRTVELTIEQLGALRDSLPESAGEPHRALPPDLFRALFEYGLLAPPELNASQSASRWIKALPSLALSPYLKIDLRFTSDGVTLTGDEPVVGIFHDPALSIAAKGLHSAIRNCLGLIVQACAVTGTPFPRDRAGVVVRDAAARWLRSAGSPLPISWTYQEDKLTLDVDPLACSSASAPLPSWSAVVEVSCRRGRREIAVPIETLPALASAIHAMNRGDPAAWSEAIAVMSVRHVFAAIEAIDGLIDTAERPAVFSSQAHATDVMAVTHMGHASLIVDGGGVRVLIDPWLFPWDDSQILRPLTAAELGDIAAICFTHHHSDHLDFGSLLALPHDIPVLIPRPTDRPLEPRLGDFLRALGFSDVRELGHGETTVFGDSLEIEAVPFYGEGRDRLGFGANCYLLSRLGRNVLIHADASPDSDGASILSTGELQEMVRSRGPMDVVFGTWWQERTFRCLLSTYAPVTPGIEPADWLVSNEQCDCPRDFVADMVTASGAQVFVTYAESGQECFVEPELRSSYVPSVSFLWIPLDQVAERVNDSSSAVVFEAAPYLTVVISADGVKVNSLKSHARRPKQS